MPEHRFFPRPDSRGPIAHFGRFRSPGVFSDWLLGPSSINIHVNAVPHVLFIWNDELIDYLGQHGVTPDEFEEADRNSDEIEASQSPGWPIVFGGTSTGKFLACVVEYVDKNQVIPVTACEVE